MTNREFVLQKLRAGPITAQSFATGFRLAPRIMELREMGYQIRSDKARGSLAIYTLEEEVQP